MPAREPSKRAALLADELRRSIRRLTHRLRAESSSFERSTSEQAVLRRLVDEGPSTTAALARAELVKPQSMGATLAVLEGDGLVVRTPDAVDARCRNVSITEKGKQTLLKGRAARQSWLARSIDEKLDATEQRTVLEALALLQRIVDP